MFIIFIELEVVKTNNNKRSMEIEREELIKFISGRIYTRRIYVEELADDILRLCSVVWRSEQSTCPRCKSTNINPDKENDDQCIECGFLLPPNGSNLLMS